MSRCSKKSKTAVNNLQEENKFDQLPPDLVIEIFRRLPLKTVARCVTLSKSFATTIRSRTFFVSFPSQPCTLITSARTLDIAYGENLYFFLSSSSSSTLSFLSRLTCPSLDDPGKYNYNHANGLICVGYGPELIVTNPCTGSFISLPSVRTRGRVVKSFFGYDPVSDQYKVLRMTEKLYGHQQDPSSQHQVFTLGGKKAWIKMIHSNIPDHRPLSNGVCIDGVVYYVAKTGQGMSQLSLMRFELRAESLNIFTNLPEEIQTPSLRSDTLIKYKGKLAIATKISRAFTFHVWVMDQDGEKHEWLKKITFSIEPWKFLTCNLGVGGTTHTGEIILATSSPHFNNYYVIYNPNKNSFKEIKIEDSAYCDKLKGRGSSTALVFWDYLESFRLLSERQFMI